MSGFDIGAYLARIGLPDVPQPTAEGLIALTSAQLRRIIFENLAPFLGRPVLLDEQSLMTKLVHRGRGGYCFELNGLMQLALNSMGVEIKPHLARVANEAGMPDRRSHLMLEAKIDGRSWLVDCGFGRSGPRHALPLELGRIDIQQGEAFRIRHDDRFRFVFETRRDGWQPLYSFGDASFQPIDIEMANFYTNMWPMQRFRTDLIAARITDQGRITLLNQTFKEYINGEMTEMHLPDRQALAKIMLQSFEMPESEIDFDSLSKHLGLDEEV